MFKIFLTLFAFLICNNMIAQTWEDISTPVTTNLILFDITFPPGQNDVGFTGGASGTWNAKGKILKTTNQGADWEIIYESDDSGTGVTAILFFDENNGFAGTQAGNLMKTTDGGSNWTSTDFDPNLNQGEVTSINFYDSDNGVILTAWGGVYITADKGDTWTQASTNVPGAANEIDYADANNLFAVGNMQKIYKSTDGGHTWGDNFQGASGWMVNLGVNFLDANTGLVTSEDGNLFITSDGGDTWTNQIVSGQGGLMRGTLIQDENTMYITATPGSVYKSTDGGVNWTLDSPVDAQPSYYKIIMTDDGSLFVSGSGSDGGTILRKIALAPVTSSNVIDHLLCNDDSSGAITLSIDGGVAPYIFEWSTGDTTQNLSNLSAGTYSCTITDGMGTSIIIENLTLTEPDALTIMMSSTSELDINEDGTATATVGGGTSGYTYVWDTNPVQTTETATGLSMGTYYVTATDVNDCEIIGSVDVDQITGLNDFPEITHINIFPNPSSGKVFLEMDFDRSLDVSIQLHNTIGQNISTMNLQNVNSVRKIFDWNQLPKGVYWLSIASGDKHVVQKIIFE